FVREGGQWVARVVADEPADVVWVVDVAAAGGPEQAWVEVRATQGPASLDQAGGAWLLAVVCVARRRGPQAVRGGHDLAARAVSGPILLEDLASAYEQAERGMPVVLPAKTTSFPAWSRRLSELAASAEVAAEAQYWRQVDSAAAPLPRDHDGPNTVASVRKV